MVNETNTSQELASPVVVQNSPESNPGLEENKNKSMEGRKPKTWITALLLSIFLGGVGVDRFYLGYIGTGILKLITMSGFGVWYIIDIILIATKHDFSKVEWIFT